ncbi:MAG: lysine transporter LysE [Ideonella sp. MAG2]|nr:MAG: lysine transporter LysE [Ideonella sp. MAG2]
MPLSDFLALLALATAMAFTPGPNTTLSAALAANRGLKAALPFCLAVPVGWMLLVLACSAGLGTVLQAVPALRSGLTLLGVAYLLWLAWKLSQAQPLGEVQADRLQVGFVQGVALQFVNIKAWMAALLVVQGWVTPGPLIERLAVVLPLMAAYALASNFSYALLGAALRPWLQQGQRLAWFNRCMALLLALTALWMALR